MGQPEMSRQSSSVVKQEAGACGSGTSLVVERRAREDVDQMRGRVATTYRQHEVEKTLSLPTSL